MQEVVLENTGERTLRLKGLTIDPGQTAMDVGAWRIARRDPMTRRILAKGVLRVVEVRPASGGVSPSPVFSQAPPSVAGPVKSTVAVEDAPAVKKTKRKSKKKAKRSKRKH